MLDKIMTKYVRFDSLKGSQLKWQKINCSSESWDFWKCFWVVLFAFFNQHDLSMFIRRFQKRIMAGNVREMKQNGLFPFIKVNEKYFGSPKHIPEWSWSKTHFVNGRKIHLSFLYPLPYKGYKKVKRQTCRVFNLHFSINLFMNWRMINSLLHMIMGRAGLSVSKF